MIIWQTIFWFSVFLILHSYLLYPWLLQILSSGRKDDPLPQSEQEFPGISILMSVYNEETVLAEKLDSILASSYPSEKIQIIVGSDASNDGTNEILDKYQERGVSCKIYKDRQGKPNIINQLIEIAEHDLLIMTDAKLFFHKDTISHLVAHFKDPEVGIVGGNIINEKIEKDGVSIQEKAFMSREILMKYREGIIWGSTIGVYGAIYALRKEHYTPVPKGFAVDDFFITLNVIRKKKKALLDISAITYEDVPNLISEEYRRKVRIAIGNFRNMRYFRKELLTPWKGPSFAYLSHKVIRWLGPFILIAFLLSNIFLCTLGKFYQYSLYTSFIVMSLPIIDFFLSKIGIHIVFLRFVRHFISMNIALLHGFIKNLGGINSDVWQPTNR